MRFFGYRSDVQVERVQDKLISLLAQDSVVTSGSVAYAGYSAPWTPPWMIRNEVLIEVQ